VDYDDRITIATPEGVELSLTLAGVGSRFVSALVDVAIQACLIIAAAIAVAAIGDAGAAVFAILSFAIVFTYDVFFEVLASGRTPGKRWNGLRVVRAEGRPVDFTSSAIRNLLRIVDFLPGGYLVGIVAVLVTRRNQRLGDLAAGTLVVRDRPAHRPEETTMPTWELRVVDAPSWDTSALTAEELSAVRRFLERRHSLDGHVRDQIAHTMAERLRPKVAGVPEEIRGERFLVDLAAAKGGRRQL
jgi:uncharacterized RDD family membrane protein YckC